MINQCESCGAIIRKRSYSDIQEFSEHINKTLQDCNKKTLQNCNENKTGLQKRNKLEM